MNAPQRYARTDPWPNVPFADELFKQPPLAEGLGWIVIGAVCIAGFVALLGF